MGFKNPPKHPFYAQRTVIIVLLTLLTFGFYQHYWHYRQWRTIQKTSGDTAFSPLLRGLFFPFFIISLVAIVRDSADIHQVSRGIARLSFAIPYTVVSFFSVGVDSVIGVAALSINTFLMCLLQAKSVQINKAFYEQCPLTNADIPNYPGLNCPAPRAVEIAKRDSENSRYQLPHRLMIELSTAVVVMIICLAVALDSGEKFIAKARILDVFSYASVAKVEVAEIHSLTGIWPEADLDYLLGDYGSPLIRNISSSGGGRVHFGLSDTPPFRDGDRVDLIAEKADEAGPIVIHRWQCVASAGNNRPDFKHYLPSICRG